MTANAWDIIDQTMRQRGTRDPQLLADWEAACDRARITKNFIEKVKFLEHYRCGDYYRERQRGGARRPATTAVGAPRAEQQQTVTYLIGRAVAAERVRARLRQADLAARVGLSRNALAKVEAEKRRLTFAEACSIADTLDISLEHLRAR